MRWLLIPALLGSAVFSGCSLAAPHPAMPNGFQTSQFDPYRGPAPVAPDFRQSPRTTLVALDQAIMVTPRGGTRTFADQPHFDVAAIEISQNNRIVLYTRDGDRLVGMTHPHGPDLGFAVTLDRDSLIEGIVHTSRQQLPIVVTLAVITPRGRILSGRQEFGLPQQPH